MKDGMRESAYHSEEDEPAVGDDEEADWEEMQIRKAMNKVQMSEAAANMAVEQQMANQAYLAGPGTGLYSQVTSEATTLHCFGATKLTNL